MASIRTSGTEPELLVRRALLAAGYRYRLGENYKKSGRKLPGKPDIVLPGRKILIFVHGCFWHRHNCHLFAWPKTRVDFWKVKLNRNHDRDIQQRRELTEQGWRVGVVWECALKGRGRICQEELNLRLKQLVEGDMPIPLEIAGTI